MSDKQLNDGIITRDSKLGFSYRGQKTRNELKQDLKSTASQAKFDKLTGLKRREELYKRLNEKSFSNTTLLFIDLDKFKEVNDLFGDHYGDEVLQIFGYRLQGRFSKSDIYRKGGEEFIVILEGATDIDKASERAEEFREYMENNPIVTKDKTVFSKTVSIGISRGADFNDPEEYIADAGRKMHYAKNTGRNRVVVAESANV